MTPSSLLTHRTGRTVAESSSARTVHDVGTREAVWSLSAVEDIRTVRHGVVDAVEAWETGAVLDDVELVLSELLTNAVLHGSPPVTVTVHFDHGIWIAVADGSSAQPVIVERDLGRVGGLGLLICASLCDSLTVTRDGDGKVVVAVLR